MKLKNLTNQLDSIILLIGIILVFISIQDIVSGFHDMDLDFNNSKILYELKQTPSNSYHITTIGEELHLGGELFMSGIKRIFKGVWMLFAGSLIIGLMLGYKQTPNKG